MNTDAVEDKLKGNWKQLKGKIKEEYSEITEDDLKYIEAQKDQMMGALQKKTGETKEKLAKFIDKYSKN